MWEIYEHRRVPRELKKLPLDVLQRYEKWKDIITISGPAGLRLIRGLNDEPLHGEWDGYRSSRLNRQYRVIYKIERQQVLVQVVKVTAHNYSR
ncbi:type II toxin-antitoxin system mRNA interferase toxin, RelE/StbE family [bacterium]|nr:type II toxin-antitoxin system mRNA interferase toxin, RelE/StbE family [bacterium]MDB9724483.1 type II toxin-antitoxin system mRNA interferase toxin, RelE/StbE family [bacterium]